MESNKIREKIEKLLCLGDITRNDSEAEVELALIKAQELMAMYNISADMIKKEPKYSTEKVSGNRIFFKFRKVLASIIAENFGCRTWLSGNSMVFMGHPESAYIARMSYEFAYDFVCKRGTSIYNKRRYLGAPTKGVFDSYASGFNAGLKSKLATQSAALMIIVPEDVDRKFEQMTQGLKVTTISTRRSDVDFNAHLEGINDGSSYSLSSNQRKK
jgi:hypothetical protein